MALPLSYILFFSVITSSFSLSDVLIKDVNAVFHLVSDHYMVLYGGAEHQASIYDAVNDEMVRDVVLTGREPWESESLSTFYYVENFGGEKSKLRIIQGEATAFASSPALFFGEGGSYLLRSEEVLTDDDKL